MKRDKGKNPERPLRPEQGRASAVTGPPWYGGEPCLDRPARPLPRKQAPGTHPDSPALVGLP